MHGRAAAHGQILDHDTLRDVRRRQEGHSTVLRSERQHRGSHIDIGHDGVVRNHGHFRLARGPGGEIQNRDIGRLHFGDDTAEQRRIGGHGAAPEFAQAGQRQRTLALAREQDPMPDRSAAQSVEHPRLFQEHGAGAAGGERLHQFRRRIAGIQRGGDGAVGENSQVGEIEFQAGFGVERDDVAASDSQAAQPGGDLLGGGLVLGPREGVPGALPVAGGRRIQCGQITVRSGGF